MCYTEQAFTTLSKVFNSNIFDKVKYDGQECFIFGRRSSGYFDLRTLHGISVHKSASYKKLELLEIRKSLLIERRMAHPHMTSVMCLCV